MESISDETRLGEMSIPGTHDTMTSHASQWVCSMYCHTQNMKLEEQLLKGIRFIDIRIAQENRHDPFKIYHGPIHLQVSLRNVLDILKNFLANHDKETVIMRWKREHGSYNLNDLKTVFEDYKFEDGKHMIHDWGRTGPKPITTPKLKDVRKQVVLITWDDDEKYFTNHRFPIQIEDNYGNIPWERYCSFVEEGQGYFESLKQNMIRSQNSNNGNKFAVTFMSYAGGNPGTYLTCQSRLNTVMSEYLEKRFVKSKKGLGIVAMDYPETSEKIIRNIIYFN